MSSVTDRKMTRQIHVGDIPVGGGAPVTVQSMTTTKTADVDGTLAQVYALRGAGADIVRITCNDVAAAQGLAEIVPRSPVPIIADIHFQYRLALAALEAGVAGLRLNPGNIRKAEHIKAVAVVAAERGVPIRVGVNAGSLDKDLLAKYGAPVPEALVESALHEIRLLEEVDFTDIKISVKHSHVPSMVDSASVRDDRLSVASRCHRGRATPGRFDEIGGGDRHVAAGGNRRHDPLLAHGRSGRRGRGRAAPAGATRFAGETGPRSDRLPVVRQGRGGCHRGRQGGPGGPGGREPSHSGGGYGMRRKRTG